MTFSRVKEAWESPIEGIREVCVFKINMLNRLCFAIPLPILSKPGHGAGFVDSSVTKKQHANRHLRRVRLRAYHRKA